MEGIFDVQRDHVQLLDLACGEELGFVDQDAGHLGGVDQKIGVGIEGVDLALRTETRGDLADAIAAVDHCRVQAHLLPLFFVVVGDLQQRCGFTGVHCRIPEIEFSHCPSSRTRKIKRAL